MERNRNLKRWRGEEWCETARVDPCIWDMIIKSLTTVVLTGVSRALAITQVPISTSYTISISFVSPKGKLIAVSNQLVLQPRSAAAKPAPLNISILSCPDHRNVWVSPWEYTVHQPAVLTIGTYDGITRQTTHAQSTPSSNSWLSYLVCNWQLGTPQMLYLCVLCIK